ncbi:MAG: L-seryl-tRNA(Sec) selenium transferase, partial [Acidobacteria bacterium]|nr:L-seryl-tRNA(Sec) selenium transferase [Acidobacteriota bacterium]NIM63446.1 L-seryl-tRNA(Sec) selenium transferase [Acidobacteriota bacterium]NIO60874.1 L-seryl-tRNA(Sec) selenium transferase [Acidobacteriota bacterium]NIQ31949.1 L-seryl-tRNA(Sec) selenium transferase [Acidobacteriota bacterium]NIQ87335.1 L-seryl-tRNA(Sec) selenium transferase [Acidobacteriota bacterium]
MQRRSRKGAENPLADRREALRELPQVGRLLESHAVSRIARKYGVELVTRLVRAEIARLRAGIVSGQLEGRALERALRAPAIARAVASRAGDLLVPRPRRVINATGVVVHTNLGRSVLSAEAAAGLAMTAQHYTDLEYALEEGGRGNRLGHLDDLMAELFPDAGFIVVNNNAAAIMLALRALARNKEVVISRGELVEIGGSFRVPDILAASGGKLREVGTTNKTRLSDYGDAIGPRTGAILKVHTSNFKIVGFTDQPKIGSLARLAAKSGKPLIVDWGSGDLAALGPLGIHDEIPVCEILDAGADVVTFSGDKLLGGPQAGFAVGRPELIAKLRKDPLARVCRLDRLLIAALHATLAAYVRGRAFEDVPTLRMLALEADQIGKRAETVRRAVAAGAGAGARIEVIDGTSKTGGGSSPTGERPTRLLAVS